LNLETNAEIWIPNNIIMFNGANQPVLRQDDANAGDILTFTETEETFRAVNTRTVSTVETQEVDTVPLTPIVENQEENQKQTEEKRQWAFDETKALIAAVDAHYEDMHHVKKRKTFWGIIAQQLQSQKVNFSEESCKKKWANLLRTYKAIKDCKKKTGRGAGARFLFYEDIDNIVGNSPTNASPHSVNISCEIGQEGATASASEASSSSSTNFISESCTSQLGRQKRLSPNASYIQFKKRFYETKQKYMQEKQDGLKRLMESQIEIQRKKVNLLEEKNEIERRKVAALEALVREHNKQNT
jgi:hypothetical protein